MSLHPRPEPGPATIAVEQQFPSLPLDPEPLSREHSKQAWALGSELFQESSQQLYSLTVIITYHLAVTAAASESRLHRVLKRHTHVQAFLAHEEAMTLLKLQTGPQRL